MRIFLRICSSVFLIIALQAIGYADEHFPFLAQVAKESVNIRSGANTNFEKLDKLNRGSEVVVLGKSFDWYKVQLPRTSKAYIRADYLKIRQDSIADLTGDKVNIRALPNSNSTSLGVIKKGEFLKTIVLTNGWWQVEPPTEAV
ncbi:MAG: SH3 domain-containing protein, partial [Candidatus Omnitrophota bacterium]